jgi:hypothetical protein
MGWEGESGSAGRRGLGGKVWEGRIGRERVDGKRWGDDGCEVRIGETGVHGETPPRGEGMGG